MRFGAIWYDITYDTFWRVNDFGSLKYSRIVGMSVYICGQRYITVPHQILCCSDVNSFFLQVSTICMPQIIWDKIIRQRKRCYKLISIVIRHFVRGGKPRISLN